MKTEYATRGTCSYKIVIETEGDTILDVKFHGGCQGNTAGISRLVQGRKIDEIIECLEGTTCRDRGTSCPDQLAKALKKVKSR